MAAQIWLNVLGLFFVVYQGWAAAPLKFPEQDLPQETVMPIFERPDVVMNRAVPTARRFEVGLAGTWTPTDPFFSPFGWGLQAGYHFNELHGLNFIYSHRLPGTTEYTDQLNNVKNVPPLRLQNAPSTQYVALLNYQATLMYGKLSLTKNWVSHLSTFVTAGLGATAIGTETLPIAAIGLGQKYYFSSSMGFRLDARLMGYEGPDVLSSSLTNDRSQVPNTRFGRAFMWDTMVTLSFIFLFPGSSSGS